MSRACLLVGFAAAALALAGCAAAPQREARSGPVRVMSINQCADQLVLALLPPERITSVTFLSRDPGASLMHEAAGRVAANHATVEEVIRQDPDLVIAGSFTTPAARAMLKRLGVPLIELDAATSFDDVRRQTRQVAAAVGEQARGEAMIADMDRTLAALAADRGPPLRVAAWDRFGFGAGEGTLLNEILAAAGARNVGGEPPASTSGQPDVEMLLASDPALLVQGSPYADAPSLGDDLTHHRIVRLRWGEGRMLTVPQAYYVCGTPAVARAAVALRDQLRRADGTP